MFFFYCWLPGKFEKGPRKGERKGVGGVGGWVGLGGVRRGKERRREEVGAEEWGEGGRGALWGGGGGSGGGWR